MQYQQQLEALVAELLKIAPDIDPADVKQKSNCITYLGWTLGILTTLTKFKAGSMATNPFGLESPKDLVEFFKNINDASTLLIVAASIGCAVFGVPAWFVNTIINAKCSMSVMTDLTTIVADIKQVGWSAYFKKISGMDKFFLGLISFTGLGYGLGYAGAGYKYSLVAIDPVPMLNMIFSGLGYTAVGISSMKKFVGAGRNAWNSSLLEEALKAADLLSALSGPV